MKDIKYWERKTATLIFMPSRVHYSLKLLLTSRKTQTWGDFRARHELHNLPLDLLSSRVKFPPQMLLWPWGWYSWFYKVHSSFEVASVIIFSMDLESKGFPQLLNLQGIKQALPPTRSPSKILFLTLFLLPSAAKAELWFLCCFKRKNSEAGDAELWQISPQGACYLNLIFNKS